MKFFLRSSNELHTYPYFQMAVLLAFAVLFLLAGCAPQTVPEISIAAQSNLQQTPEIGTPVFHTITPQSETPIATTTPTLITCQETRGKLADIEVPNTVLSYPLKVKVYFPPCYSEKPEKPYPYVIMIHGMLYKYDQWDRLGADEAADELIVSGEAPPFLIFMPFEEQTTVNPFEDGFGTAILESLIPYVEENLPVCKERACRAIGGLSRGAGWAIHLGLSKPQYFASIGAHSLPPFIGDLASAPRWLSVIPQADLPRIYIDIGIADSGMSPARQFEQILTAYNVPHEWYINNGEHTETYWAAHVKEYMRWYAKGWLPEVPPEIMP